MNPVVAAHVRLNQQSIDAWQSVTSHRRKVTELLRHAATKAQPPAERLAVLGAGNCNDLDLATLSQLYREVELFDIDIDAVEQGVRRQCAEPFADEARRRIQIAPPTDVTGIADLLSQWPIDGQDDCSATKLIEQRLNDLPEGVPVQSFDVVVSVCLLSQLIFSVTQTIGLSPLGMRIIQSLRRQHLHLLLSMLRRKGIAVLIVDFVSSDTAPELHSISESMLPEAASELINRQNFFTGLNPGVIAHQLRNDAQLSVEIASLQQVLPWFWDLGRRRYAVCGYVIQRT